MQKLFIVMLLMSLLNLNIMAMNNSNSNDLQLKKRADIISAMNNLNNNLVAEMKNLAGGQHAFRDLDYIASAELMELTKSNINYNQEMDRLQSMLNNLLKSNTGFDNIMQDISSKIANTDDTKK